MAGNALSSVNIYSRQDVGFNVCVLITDAVLFTKQNIAPKIASLIYVEDYCTKNSLSLTAKGNFSLASKINWPSLNINHAISNLLR